MPFANLNGVRIRYEVAGAGHPIVLIHGHALDCRLWREQVGPLAPYYTLVRYDIRGHGQSEAPPAGYSRPHYAEELRALVEHLGLTRPSLVGHSMGGGIALEYALRYPTRMSTLSLVCTGLEGASYPESLSQVVAKQKGVLRREGKSAKFLRAAVISSLFDGVRRKPEKLALVKSMLADWSGANWLDDTVYPTPLKLHVERLGELKVPVLVVLGEKDGETFRHAADTLVRGITVVRSAIVPDAGHLAPLENPEAFNDILMDFVGGAAGKALI